MLALKIVVGLIILSSLFVASLYHLKEDEGQEAELKYNQLNDMMNQ